jgi:Tfp pilus assembly protein PilX
MSRRLLSERGLALVPVMALMLAMLALGFSLVMRSRNQQQLSAYERTRESSFNVAEAALNAQALQLGRTWPTASSSPTSCSPGSTSSICPTSSAIGNGYSYAASCIGSSTPIWQTTIRDNVTGEVYWTTAVSSRSAYDANNDGTVWVRSTGYVQCNKVSMVTLVSRNVVQTSFPNNTLSANWFATTNPGRKVFIDTVGNYAEPPSLRPAPGTNPQPAPVNARCSGLTSSQCANYQADKGQIQPPAVTMNPGGSSAVTLTQLQSLEQQAISSGTFWAAGTCPSSTSSLSSAGGAPVVIQGPCDITVGSNSTVNSSASPGALIIENGTFTIGGSAVFYGLLYCVNKQASSGSVVTIGGNSTIQGVVAVDGLGGVTVGSSKTNLIYDSRATTLLKGSSGASANKNSFRLLPQSTP